MRSGGETHRVKIRFETFNGLHRIQRRSRRGFQKSFSIDQSASRRCSARGFSAPALANILNSSRSKEDRCRKSCMLVKDLSRRVFAICCTWELLMPCIRQKPSLMDVSDSTAHNHSEYATETGRIFRPRRCASLIKVAGE